MSQDIMGFQFEPDGVTTSDRSSLTYDESSGTAVVGNDRLSSLDWCSCQNCVIMQRNKECLCCKEMAEFLNLYDSEGLKCIVDHRDFDPIVLLKGNLWTALVSLHDTLNKGLKNMEDISNRSFRYAAYRQFCWWVHNRLGRGVRRVIPSCVVTSSRRKYPDRENNYVGFKENEEVSETELTWSSS